MDNSLSKNDNSEEYVDCVICIDRFNFLDLILVLNCGHQLHYSCGLRIKNKKYCCICKTLVKHTAKFLYKSPLSFFKKDVDFYSVALNSIIFNDLIKKKVSAIKNEYKMELVKKHFSIIEKFTEKNLNLFRVKILSAINKGETDTDLCFFEYGDLIEDTPAVFLIYGTKNEGENYFKYNKIPSLITYIEYRLGFEFKITPRRSSNKNYLRCNWKVNIISRPNCRHITQI